MDDRLRSLLTSGGEVRPDKEDVTSIVADESVVFIISLRKGDEILIFCRRFNTVIKPLSSLFSPTAANNYFATWVTFFLRTLRPSFTHDMLLPSLLWNISVLVFTGPGADFPLYSLIARVWETHWLEAVSWFVVSVWIHFLSISLFFLFFFLFKQFDTIH